MGTKRNAYRILVRKLLGKYSVDEMIILNWIQKNLSCPVSVSGFSVSGADTVGIAN
jgi:hypothetical protein